MPQRRLTAPVKVFHEARIELPMMFTMLIKLDDPIPGCMPPGAQTVALSPRKAIWRKRLREGHFWQKVVLSLKISTNPQSLHGTRGL